MPAEDEVPAVHVLPVDGQAKPRDDLEDPEQDDDEEDVTQYEDADDFEDLTGLVVDYCQPMLLDICPRICYHTASMSAS